MEQLAVQVWVFGEHHYPDKQTLGTPALDSPLNNYKFPSVLIGISNRSPCTLVQGGGLVPRQSSGTVV